MNKFVIIESTKRINIKPFHKFKHVLTISHTNRKILGKTLLLNSNDTQKRINNIQIVVVVLCNVPQFSMCIIMFRTVATVTNKDFSLESRARIYPAILC